MDKTILNRLMIIASIGLEIAGIVFLCISIFGNGESTRPLACALGCILLASLFNLIRNLNNRRK